MGCSAPPRCFVNLTPILHPYSGVHVRTAARRRHWPATARRWRGRQSVCGPGRRQRRCANTAGGEAALFRCSAHPPSARWLQELICRLPHMQHFDTPSGHSCDSTCALPLSLVRAAAFRLAMACRSPLLCSLPRAAPRGLTRDSCAARPLTNKWFGRCRLCCKFLYAWTLIAAPPVRCRAASAHQLPLLLGSGR